MNNSSTHSEGNITFKAAQAIKERFLFGTIVDGKIAPVNGTNRAIAVITDCAAQNEPVNAQFMGSNAGTMKVLAGGTITAGELIVANASGKALSWKDQPKGSYQICGVALTNSSSGQYLEFTPTLGFELSKS